MLVPAERARLVDDPAAAQDRPAECPRLLARPGGTAGAEGRIEAAGRDELRAPEGHVVADSDDAVHKWIQQPPRDRPGPQVVCAALHPLGEARILLEALLRFGLELERQHHATRDQDLV